MDHFIGFPILLALIAGNANDLLSSKAWETYSEWAKSYGKAVVHSTSYKMTYGLAGDIIHLRLFNQHFVVMNPENHTVEVFEKRLNNYSDRQYTNCECS